MEEANKLAGQILSKGLPAVQNAKEVILRGADLDLANANAYEITAFAALCESDDKNEGLTAFLEKRAAGFRGSRGKRVKTATRLSSPLRLGAKGSSLKSKSS